MLNNGKLICKLFLSDCHQHPSSRTSLLMSLWAAAARRWSGISSRESICSGEFVPSREKHKKARDHTRHGGWKCKTLSCWAQNLGIHQEKIFLFLLAFNLKFKLNTTWWGLDFWEDYFLKVQILPKLHWTLGPVSFLSEAIASSSLKAQRKTKKRRKRLRAEATGSNSDSMRLSARQIRRNKEAHFQLWLVCWRPASPGTISATKQQHNLFCWQERI